MAEDKRKNNRGTIGNAGGGRTLGSLSSKIKDHGDKRVIRSIKATDDEYMILRKVASAIKKNPDLKKEVMDYLNSL